MSYQPSSMVLFLSICSLNKIHGGDPQYDKEESVAFALPSDVRERLLNRREQMRQLVKSASELNWQGVPLAELEFNKSLVRGEDFGGHHTAEYYPALRRYNGRFFQTLGADGKRQLYNSKHHTLFLSGLYGLLRPMESIQLYSCPVKPQVAEKWLEDDLLTDVLCRYVRQYNVARIFDMTALMAYRNLIDWSKITATTGVDVLYCFYTMSAGDYALIPFAQLMKDRLLDAPEDELISIEPETRIGDVVFRAVEVTQPGLPDEFKLIQAAERELPLLQSQSVDYVDKVLQGGHPIISADAIEPQAREDWLFAISSHFRKDYHEKDKVLAAQIMTAIVDICRAPMNLRGDTVKPLGGALKGKWRYRLGDHRLVYFPDKDKHTVYLLKITSRGDPELYA